MFFDYPDSWFSNVSDQDIKDFAIQYFNFYAPDVSRMKTENGCDYIRVDGLKINPEGSVVKDTLDLGVYSPVIVDGGSLYIDLEKIHSNLEACKQFIIMMDRKNLGKYISGSSYSKTADSIFRYIVKQQCEKTPEEVIK